jgi:hypothetical protein
MATCSLSVLYVGILEFQYACLREYAAGEHRGTRAEGMYSTTNLREYAAGEHRGTRAEGAHTLAYALALYTRAGQTQGQTR